MKWSDRLDGTRRRVRPLRLMFLAVVLTSCGESTPGVKPAAPSAAHFDPSESFERAAVLLGESYFPHQDVPIDEVSKQVERLRRAPQAWQARYFYLRARSSGIRADYSEALRWARQAQPRLDEQRQEEMSVLIPFWEAMVFAQADGLLHYDEDVQILRPRFIKDSVQTKSAWAKRLERQTSALFSLAQVLATGSMSIQAQPFFPVFRESVSEQLRAAFCSGQERDCTEFSLLRIPLLARTGAPEEAKELALTLAKRLSQAGKDRLAARCSLSAGDLTLAPHSGPYELGLFPLATMETTMALNNGLRAREFELPEQASIKDAEQLYRVAETSLSRTPSADLSAQLIVRKAFLAWSRGDFSSATRGYSEAAGKLRHLGSRRWTQRAETAALVASILSDEDVGTHRSIWLKGLSNAVDFGVFLGSARVLERASFFAQNARYDVHAAYEVREAAIESMRKLGASQRLGALLAEQASLLNGLGQFHDALLRLREAIAQHRYYLDAIEKIELFARSPGKIEEQKNAIRQAMYAQIMDQVNIRLKLDDPEGARQANEQLEQLEHAGIPPSMKVVVGAQSTVNQIHIRIQELDFDGALQLAQNSDNDELAAIILLLRGRNREAARAFEGQATRALQKLESLPSDGRPETELGRQLARGELERALAALIRAKEFQSARSYYGRAEKTLGPGHTFANQERPYERPLFLARLYAGLGEGNQAERWFEEAMASLEQQTRLAQRIRNASAFDSETRTARAEYISFLLDDGQINRGIEALEKHRARDFQNTLIVNAALSELAREEMRNWLAADSRLELVLRQGRKKNESERAFVLRRKELDKQVAEARAKVLARLTDTDVRKVAFRGLTKRAEARLKRHPSTLILYHLHGEQSSAVVLRVGKDPVVRRLPIANFEITPAVNALVADLEYGDVDWALRSARLYEMLLEPLQDLLPTAVSGQFPYLGIIPFGEAHRVPFQALTNGERILIEDYNVFYFPSLLSYVSQPKGRDLSSGTPFRAMGYNGTRLQQAEREAIALDPRAVVGPKATRSELFSLLGNPGVMILSTHAEVNPQNPLLSFLRLADGDLHLHELRGHPMSCDLVVLSACATSAGERQRSDQLTAIVSPFLEGGVPAVVATGWTIDDSLTLDLMTNFQKQLRASLDPAAALGAAQRRALQEPGEAAHPSYWAAFSLIGDLR